MYSIVQVLVQPSVYMTGPEQNLVITWVIDSYSIVIVKHQIMKVGFHEHQWPFIFPWAFMNTHQIIIIIPCSTEDSVEVRLNVIVLWFHT